MKASGPIDVMLNNAALMPQAPLEQLRIDDWDRMMDGKLKGVLYGIAAVLPDCKNSKAATSSTCRRPFSWMSEAMDLKKEKNFFETRVIEYQNGGALVWD